jgi:putative addiction module component (TIGR02574 family)
MSRKTLLEAALALTPDERIELAGDLWDSISAIPEAIELTEAQRAELRQRLAQHRAAPSETLPWDEVRDALLKR